VNGSNDAMWEYLRLRWRIWRLDRQYRADEEGTAQAVEKATSQQEIDEILGGSDQGVIQRRIDEAHTKYLMSRARRLVVPLPDWNDDRLWSIEANTGEHVLTAAGINELRAAIRAEKKARREAVQSWLPWVGALTGIIGALTGLFAVLAKGAK